MKYKKGDLLQAKFGKDTTKKGHLATLIITECYENGNPPSFHIGTYTVLYLSSANSKIIGQTTVLSEATIDQHYDLIA
jgi:hypothetical protein